LRFRRLAISLCLCGVALAQRSLYEGPSILSRGVGPVMGGGGELIRLRPFVGVNGLYDSGLTPVSVDSQGRLLEDDAYGAEVHFGALGYHSWRRTVLGLDYRGNVRHYTQKTYYDGSDHQLSLGVTHQFSRRWAVSFREAAGTYSRNYGLFGGLGYFDREFANTPADELFDGRTHYASTMGDLTFYKSPRLSFNMGGTGFVVRRRSQSLVGVTGANARGDIAWRVSRRHVIGVDYGFNHYEFTRGFGGADFHLAAFNWSVEFGRRWQFGIRAGGARVEVLGLRYVAVDPVIAAIIGQTTGIEAYHALNYVSQGDVRLMRSFQRSNLTLYYSRGLDPGNGIFLTSQRDSAGLSYSHTFSRRWNVGVNAGYGGYSSLGQGLGKYRSVEGGGGFACQLSRFLHLVGHVAARDYEVRSSALQRTHLRATIGFSLSPGDLPLSLW